MGSLSDFNNNMLNLASVYMNLMNREKERTYAKGIDQLNFLVQKGNSEGVTPELQAQIDEAAKAVWGNRKGMNGINPSQQEGFVAQPQQPPAQVPSFGGKKPSLGTPQIGTPSDSGLNLDLLKNLLVPQQGLELAPQDQEGFGAEEAQLIGPAKSYMDFASEVASEMGIAVDDKGTPVNLIGGQPLKDYRKESYNRYRQYLKDRDVTIRQLVIQNRNEKKQMRMQKDMFEQQDKIEAAREAKQLKMQQELFKQQDELEALREASRRKAEQAAEKRTMMREQGAEKRTIIREQGAEKRTVMRETAAEKRLRLKESGTESRFQRREAGTESRFQRKEGGTESRFERRLKSRELGLDAKRKLVTIYGPGGQTRMIPVDVNREYSPPQGWSLNKPSEKQRQIEQLTGGSQSGAIAGYKWVNGKLVPVR